MLALSVEFDVSRDGRPPTALTAQRACANDGESALVRAARSGDRAAFACLHERYAPMVHGIALMRVPPADAVDLVQETFLRALERLALLRDDGAFGPWIAAIVRNLAVEAHRRQAIRRHEALTDLPARSSSADDGKAADHSALRLLELIRTLPEAYGETLVLRLVEGLSGAQIAACMGMTHGSVRVNLTRGMRLLRERLNVTQFKLEVSP